MSIMHVIHGFFLLFYFCVSVEMLNFEMPAAYEHNTVFDTVEEKIFFQKRTKECF